jgi:BMFP domain-containing protein YqiC
MNFFEEVFFMKKSIASALTMAVVLGAASTTFAAHADDEVAALKARVADLERVVREQNERIIREQKNSNANTRREVENLDYRLTELENADNDSWTDKFNLTGELRYRLWSRHENADVSQLQMRLFPTFNIDEHLAVKCRCLQMQIKDFLLMTSSVACRSLQEKMLKLLLMAVILKAIII